jgi:hypothetical protein
VKVSPLYLDELTPYTATVYVKKYDADQLARAWRATTSEPLLRELAARIATVPAQVHLGDPRKWKQEDMAQGFVILTDARVVMDVTTCEAPSHVRQLEFSIDSDPESETEVSASESAEESSDSESVTEVTEVSESEAAQEPANDSDVQAIVPASDSDEPCLLRGSRLHTDDDVARAILRVKRRRERQRRRDKVRAAKRIRYQ